MTKLPVLVAHRGDAERFPENTLLGLEAAFRCGACIVEFDIQISADGVPVLFHDYELQRIVGVPGTVCDMPLQNLQLFDVSEPARLGNRFSQIRIPTLAQAITLLKRWPNRHAFMEIKPESLKAFGIHKVVKAVMAVIENDVEQLTIISKDMLVLSHVRALGARSIGWVIDTWGEESRSQAARLVPNYLFANYRGIPSDADNLWPGPWQWVLYDVTKPELACILATWGAQFIETWDVETMLQDDKLRTKACIEH